MTPVACLATGDRGQRFLALPKSALPWDLPEAAEVAEAC
jgi:hypothetical protein